MNFSYHSLIKIVGALLLLTAVFLTIPLLIAFVYNETQSAKAFSYVIIPTFIIGLLIILLSKKRETKLHLRDGFLIVTMSWFIVSLLGAIPFVLSAAIPSYVDAFFETCSGLSTTGASILSDIEALPKSMLFWRSFTHWLGGMGIIVLAVALLPALGIGGQCIAEAEAPGPTLSKITPKIADTAKILYLTYLGFTVVETLLLWAGGLSFFDAITQTFATVGTGGFSTKNIGIAAFDSAYVEWVITAFMFLSGVSFILYFTALKRGPKIFIKDDEFKSYFSITLVATIIITIILFAAGFGNLSDSIRASAFQVLTILTTTGFATSDFALWPMAAQMILLAMFFIGASSGSTGGGVKVIRIIVLFKLINKNILSRIHPNSITEIKINHNPLANGVTSNIASFIFLYIAAVALGTVLVSVDDLGLVTSFTAAAACVGNIGPGFDAVGPTMNYGMFSDFSKIVLSILMVAGRLELFTVFMLFSRRFWNPYN
ncbi:MAG: TrkH family potassium uptake protein [Anaerovoracaceae bacterium]